MSELSKKYSEIMSELENRISDKEMLAFVKEKISEISIIYMDIVDRMSGILEDKIIDIENGQKNIEIEVSKLQNTINSIEEDIYEDGIDTEIVCPYCNNEFFAELNNNENAEIECPECHNIIELDVK